MRLAHNILGCASRAGVALRAASVAGALVYGIFAFFLSPLAMWVWAVTVLAVGFIVYAKNKNDAKTCVEPAMPISIGLIGYLLHWGAPMHFVFFVFLVGALAAILSTMDIAVGGWAVSAFLAVLLFGLGYAGINPAILCVVGFVIAFIVTAFLAFKATRVFTRYFGKCIKWG